MILKLNRLPEEDIEVASVMIASLESSVSWEVLPVEEHDEKASVATPSSDPPGSDNVSLIVKLKQSASGFVKEASKKLP